MEPTPSREEAERHVRDAAARHGEAVAAFAQRGRSSTGDATAASALGRGAALVVYALRRAHAAGVDLARLSEASGWNPDAVRTALDPDAEPQLERLLPDGADSTATSLAKATLDAMAGLDALLHRISVHVTDPAWSPTPESLHGLREQLERDWLAWRQEHQRIP